MRQHFLFSILCFLATASARKVSPFFNRYDEGIQVEVDAQGSVQNFKKLKESAMRRRLAVGSHPNLPGGDGYGDYGAQDGDGEDGAASGSTENRLIGKGAKSAKGKGEAGKLPKKSSKGGKGKGGKGEGKGKGSSGDTGDDSSGGMESWDDDWAGVEPPEPCMCTDDYCECDTGLNTEYEFVMVRDEIGSDTPNDAEFGVASGIGMNGHVYKMIYTTNGRDFGGDPIGMFKGFCTVVSNLNGELLCTYEIYISADGDSGLGGVIATGPVGGLETGQEFKSIVTGAEFDFSVFNNGYLTTVQDPQKPILYSFLSFSV